MKKMLFVFLCLILSLNVFASGKEEVTEISVLTAGDPVMANGKTLMEMAIARLHQDYPDVNVTVNIVDLSDGSTLTMDAMLAAGTAPNIYSDFIGRTGKYTVPEYALPLNGLVSDLDAYMPGMIDPLTKNGKVLALPKTGGVYAMCINLDLLEDVGYTLPAVEDWTVDEFLKMCAAVKAKYDGEKWGTGMFAANQSGDYLINNWFASFGVQYYADGYDHTTIKTTGGAKFYEFVQLLNKKGYIPPNAGPLADDDYVIQWAKGQLAATGFFEGWTEYYFKSYENEVKDKETGETYGRFNYTFYPFPKAAGVDKVPAYFINHTIVVHKTGNKTEDMIAAKLAEYMNSAEIQELESVNNVCMTRTDAVSRATSAQVPNISAIAEENGIFDVGISQAFYAIVRPLHFPILQKVLNGDYTPEEAITEYERVINAAL